MRETGAAGIYIGLGANLPSPRFGPPRATLAAALAALASRGIGIRKRSSFYESAPVPVSDQPWFVNAVIEAETELSPQALLSVLNGIEAAFGRVRAEINAPRIIDLDLLAYGARVDPGPIPPILPHPGLASRAFVLLPLREISPHWLHPALGKDIDSLIAGLPPNQEIRLT
jgi:2-amino-4-hydroxy-6-hydroxymethyldihydropteridine diphosphokinase